MDRTRYHKLTAFLTSALCIAGSASLTHAADRFWSGGTGTYNNPAAWGGTIPGVTDNAINDSGLGNVVQINVGNPDWTVGQIRAGNSVGNGAFVQNGQVVTALGTNYNGSVISEFFTPFRLGIVAADTGVYTLNDGTLNYGTGPLHVGEVGTGILNINGGNIIGSGVFSVNSGGIAVPNPAVVTATAGHGPYLGDYTYFEQGYSTAFPAIGLPPAGTTIISLTQADHSYTMAASYTANNAVILDAAVPNATITLTTPQVLSGLSFVGSAGNGPVIVNYTVNYASGAPDAGSLAVPDWFGTGQEVLNVEGRVQGTGLDLQYPGPAGGNPVGNAPYLLSVDISLVNTDKVVSVNLTYVSGNGNQFATATLLGVSGQDTVGNPFTPLAFTGYNADVVVEAAAPSPFVSSSIMDIVTQTAGTNTVNNEVWVAQGANAHGTYNLSGGSLNASNWTVIGRAGGVGTFNMTGGTINKAGGGNLIIGSAAGNNSLAGSSGTMNHSGGTINNANQYWLAENTLTTATNNISGTAVLNLTGNFIVGNGGTATVNQSGGAVNAANESWLGQSGTGNGTYNMSGGTWTGNNWFSIGRNGGVGVVNLTNGAITKTGGGNFSIGGDGGAFGTLNQSGGTFTNFSGITYLGQGGGHGNWTMDGGIAVLGVLQFCEGGNGSGVLTLNNGVISASEVNCGLAGANGTFTFNGGTLRATADNANFFHDLGTANIQSGGAIIDSQGFNITVAQTLADNGGGGLTKVGAGTLTLSGANSYTGPTVVGAGTLGLKTGTTANGDYSVANGAALGVQVVGAADTSVNAANVTFASTATTLVIDLNSLHPTVNAPLNVTGNLAVNGTVTINILDGAPTLGTFPLIKYVSKTGVGSFVLGTVPSGMAATLVNNIANSSIDLNVTQTVATPRWDGAQAGGLWDINTTANWYDIGSLPALVPTVFNNGMTVLFDDNASNPNVVLNTTVNPKGVTVNNSSLAYVLSGSGKITGTNGLTKQGTSTLAIQNAGGNDYTGATVIANGTLSVSSLANGGSPSAIGASSASQSNLVFAGGALSYTGSSVSVNRGYTVTAGGSSIETVGDLTLSGVARGPSGTTFNKTGLGQLTYTGVSSSNVLCDFNVGSSTYLIRAGTVVLDGSGGAQTNISRNTNLGADPGVDPTLILTNTTLVTRSMQLGNDANCTGTLVMNNNSLMTVAANNFAVGYSTTTTSAGVLTQNPGSAVDASAELWVGQGALATGTYNMNGGTAIFRNWAAIGRNGGSGTFNLTGGTVMKPNSGGNFMIGSRDGTTGSRGTLNHSGGTLMVGSEYWIGEAQNNFAGSVGTNNISGTATLIVSNWIAIGREGAIGVLNLSGGSITKLGNNGNNIEIGNGAGSSGTINQTGGAFTNTISETRLGTGAPGIWNMSGGTANLAALVLCLNSGCTNGTLNLSGGVLTATEIRANQTGVANVSTLNWNGGTIVAGNGANTNFLRNLTRANILAGGAVIDSSTNIINVIQPLLDGTGGGGLTKTGNGTLRLNGTNTYTGTTLVNVGTLGGTGMIIGPVSVASGANLAPGASIGTLTISNTLTLSAGSTTFVEISLNGGVTNNDVVTGLTGVAYAGSLVVTNIGTNALAAGNVFKLFNSAAPGSGNFSSVTILPIGSGTFNPATGEVTVTSVGAPTVNPPYTSGGNLILTGTGGAPGGSYNWLTSTNVATPIGAWTTNTTGVFSGSGTFSNAIPVSTSEGARFFRLKTP